ncbi:hypothetical protein BDN67DRAFT_829040 [Paxillus ammoniavirescens]|nr:hypothetical protein BDN67DRAFT_829040 [Paxillus ammoniavirescens]
MLTETARRTGLSAGPPATQTPTGLQQGQEHLHERFHAQTSRRHTSHTPESRARDCQSSGSRGGTGQHILGCRFNSHV